MWIELRRLAALRAHLMTLGVRTVKIALRGGVTDDRETRRGFLVYIRKQRFAEGPFRETECTVVGPVDKPARPMVSCPQQPSSAPRAP